MLVVGLTGSIGMGKSTIAAMFKSRGHPVFDADAEVHRLYSAEAVPLVERAFPGTAADGHVDRVKLAAALAKDPQGFKRLEAIVHPLVRAGEIAFIDAQKKAGAAFAILEVPLLYETGLEKALDKVIVVSARPDVQRARVLTRPNMTPERLDDILSRQTPDAEKRRRGDFVVDTNAHLTDCEARVDAIIRELETAQGGAYERYWKMPAV